MRPGPFIERKGARVDAARYIAALLACCSLSGCLPIPNMHFFAPAVSGIITRDGAPVQNVEVTVASPFTNTRMSARTNSVGRYAVAALKEGRLFVVVLGDPLHDYRMDIYVAGRTYLGAHEVRIGDAPREDNERALHLYKQLGFSVEGRKARGMRVPGSSPSPTDRSTSPIPSGWKNWGDA